MIDSLRVRNFQTHKKLTIKFDPAITTIVGSSDRGKSAILRALRWLCFNKPDGDSFIREGSSFAKVQIKVDGHVIARTRGKTNSYTLDGKELVSFGRGRLPDEVAQILNVNPVSFQRQHDPAFWVAESSAEISRQLNEIIDLGAIDEALVEMGRRTRESKMAVKITKRNLDESRALKKELSYVPKMVREAEALKFRTKTLKDLEADIEDLSVMVSNFEEVRKRRSQILKAKSDAAALRKRELAIERRAASLRRLETTVAQIDWINRYVQEGSAQLQALLDQAERLKAESVSLDRLAEAIETLESTEKQLCELKKSNITNSDLNTTCPTCGQII